jgi:hypothetical protein
MPGQRARRWPRRPVDERARSVAGPDEPAARIDVRGTQIPRAARANPGVQIGVLNVERVVEVSGVMQLATRPKDNFFM